MVDDSADRTPASDRESEVGVSFDVACSWLRSVHDPTIDLLLAVEIDGVDPASCRALVDAVVDSEPVRSVLVVQNADGSWGPRDVDPRQRILGTLHMLHTVAVLGIGAHPRTHKAIEFLTRYAHTDDGVFSISGRRDGVLSCYVGTAAAAYLLCGQPGIAQHQIDWILRHQDVARGGVRLRQEAAETWGDYLQTRYGGCMAATTCLVGLAKVGRALQLHADLTGDVEGRSLRTAIRDAFLDRRLMFDSKNRVVPLGVTPPRASDWLAPTFPLDWHTDLIEVLDVVGRAGPFDTRMQSAIDALEASQLPDGSWPLRRSFWPNDMRVRERWNAKKGCPIVTMRAALAMRACRRR